MMKNDILHRQLFFEGIFLRYGYDFRSYSSASLARRVDSLLTKTGEASLLDVLKKCLDDAGYFARLLPMLTVGTTEPFRDPYFFRAIREKVVPLFGRYPAINLWIAGCSTGEELYSMGIVLKEEGLLERTMIYATDINPEALKVAKQAIYPAEVIQQFAKNYTEAGGKLSPAEYYTADYGVARFDASLRQNIVFAEHNLVTDGVFVEAHLILCRNVLIYFSRDLQNRVFELFSGSLAHRGFLALGSKESIRFSPNAKEFEDFDHSARIYRKLAD